MKNRKQLIGILSQYPIGQIQDITPIAEGNVNSTCEVIASAGKFVLQGLGGIFNDPSVIADQAIIGQQLRNNGVNVPEVMLTQEGASFIRSRSRLWKLTDFIGHARDEREVWTLDHCVASAEALAEFHVAATRISYTPRFRIPMFHDTMAHLVRLRRLFAEKNEKSFNEEAVALYREIEEVAALKDFLIFDGGSFQIIHGDPKLGNFLFDKGRKVAGIVDLDTLMIGSTLYDIGDALRSWIKLISVNEREGIDKAVEAYNRVCVSSGIKGVTMECAYVAMRYIALELAIRYLEDFFDESYFKLLSGSTSLATQNLSKAKATLEIAKMTSP